MIVLLRRFSNVLISETEICPTLEAGAGGGGNNLPMIMSYQEVTGTLNPGAHAGSYNGQDAYNDLLVVNDIHNSETGLSHEGVVESGVCADGNGLQGSANNHHRGGA